MDVYICISVLMAFHQIAAVLPANFFLLGQLDQLAST